MSHKNLLVVVVSLAVCLFLQGTVATATELIWTPINPSFGGSPYNSTWLLQSAQVQNKLKEPYDYSRWQRNMLQDFQESLNRQILSRVSRKIVDMAFGEQALEPGHYDIGDYVIDVTVGTDSIAVVVTDPENGDKVEVEVPYY